jgi:flagellar basal body-associated protein FliL
MCNSEFEFVPELTSESPGTEIETSEPTDPETDESASLIVMYVIVPLIAILVVIGAVIFVVKRRKAARFAEVICCSKLGTKKNEVVISNSICLENLCSLKKCTANKTI